MQPFCGFYRYFVRKTGKTTPFKSFYIVPTWWNLLQLPVVRDHNFGWVRRIKVLVGAEFNFFFSNKDQFFCPKIATCCTAGCLASTYFLVEFECSVNYIIKKYFIRCHSLEILSYEKLSLPNMPTLTPPYSEQFHSMEQSFQSRAVKKSHNICIHSMKISYQLQPCFY